MYLLDTNVVSELRRPKPHGAVVEWLRGLDDKDVAICAVTIGEIQAGIEKTRKQDASRAHELEAWLAEIERSRAILPMDAAAFRTWGRLMHGQAPTLAIDAMIAAVALTHGLIVATRNVRDFARFGVKVVDPFAGLQAH